MHIAQPLLCAMCGVCVWLWGVCGVVVVSMWGLWVALASDVPRGGRPERDSGAVRMAHRDFVWGSHVTRWLAISRGRRLSGRSPAHLRCVGLRILRSREGVKFRRHIYRLSAFFCVCPDNSKCRKKMEDASSSFDSPSEYIHPAESAITIASGLEEGVVVVSDYLRF